jgi:hypothetical protein
LASPQGSRWSAARCWCRAMTPRHVTYLRLAIRASTDGSGS